MTEQFLAGLNIVVTRPREQAVGLAQRIEQHGGHAILFPLLEINPVTWAVVNAQFTHALTHRLHITRQPMRQSRQSRGDEGPGALVPQARFSFREGLGLLQVDHCSNVVYKLRPYNPWCLLPPGDKSA